MKTKKLLSVLMALMMLIGCVSISAAALEINFPASLGQGVVKFRGVGSIFSAEIPVAAEFTEVSQEAAFTVYYSAEKEDSILDALNRKEVGVIGSGDAYVRDGVLHLDLKGLSLADEGYYYITVGGGSLRYEGYYNATATTEGVLYQFASLAAADKVVAIFDFIGGLFSNLFASGKMY